MENISSVLWKIKTKMNAHQVPAKSELVITILGRQFGKNTFLLINKNVVLKADVFYIFTGQLAFTLPQNSPSIL